MTLVEFLRVVRSGMTIVVLCVLVCVALGAGVLLTQSPVYRASAVISVEVALPAEATEEAIEASINYAKQRTISFEVLVPTAPVLDPVIREYELDLSVDELASRVEAYSALDTAVVEITVTWPDATEAAELANAIAASASREFSSSNDVLDVIVRTVTPATAPTTPIAPNPALSLGLAVAIGLVLGSAIVLVRRALVVASVDRGAAE